MDRRQLLTGLLAASAAPAIANGPDVLSGSGSTDKSTFMVTQSLLDISVTETAVGLLIGESLGLAIDGDGGFSVTDDYADIAIVVDWDDSGATIDHSVPNFGNSAETSYGRVVNHAWSTAGTKIVTITGYVYGQAIRQQTISVTVVDPGTISWDHEWYVDLTGDTTGMPAEKGNVNRITSYSEWASLDNSTVAGELVRVYFRRGKRHTLSMTSMAVHRQNAALMYYTTFDGGSRPVIDSSGGTYSNNGYFFCYPRVDGQRVVIDGYEFDGNYNSSAGGITGQRLGFYQVTNDNCYFSISNCTFTSLGLGSNVASSNANGGTFFYNCTTNQSGFADFVCLSAGKWLCAFGCEFRTDPVSGAGDSKVADTGSPTWPDHAAFRAEPSTYCAFDLCDVAVHNAGWGSLSPEFDQQPFMRYYQTHKTIGTYLGNFQRINCYASRFMVIESGPGATSLSALGRVQVEHCKFIGTRAVGSFNGMLSTCNLGGVTVQNCVIGVPDLEMSRPRSQFRVLGFQLGTSVSSANQQQPCWIRSNTIFSELTFESGEDLELFVEVSGTNWDITTANNLLSGDNHRNSGSLITAASFSTGDNFRPVTGTAAETSAVGTLPYFDFEHGARGGTTNRGAHDSASTITNASAPVYSGSNITIAQVVGSTTQIQVTDLDMANWSNFNPYLIQYTWQIGGADPTAGAEYAHIPYYRDSGSDSGKITCKIRTTTFGGTATANSNSNLTT